MTPTDRSFELALEMRRAGRQDEVLRICRKLLRRQPTHHRALALLAHAALDAGQPQHAREAAQRLTKLRPDDVAGWNLLGRASLFMGDADGARSAQRRATEIAPGDPWAWAQLGLAQQMAGNTGEGLDALRKAHRLSPDVPAIRYNYVLSLIDALEAEEAERLCREALEGDATNADFEYLLGMSLITRKQASAALRVLRESAARHPAHQGIRAIYGSALAMCGEGNRAAFELREALRLDPNDLTSRDNLVKVLSRSGALAEALGELDQLEARTGPREDSALKRATLLARKGDYDQAGELVGDFLDAPEHRLVALDVLAQTAPSTGRLDEAIERIQRALADADIQALDDKAREQLNVLEFHLGGLLDRRGDYPEAFAAYARANRGQHQAYDRDGDAALVERLRDTYTSASFARLARSTRTSTLPVFIVGMPRSGTSLLEQMLDCHPEVHGAGELSAVPNMLEELRLDPDRAYPEFADAIDSEELDELADRHLAYLRQLGGSASFVVDKSPSNFVNLGFLAQLLPGARIIHCKRTPQATALSIYFQNFFSHLHPYANDLGDIGFRYRLYLELMAHWHEVLPLEIMDVDYERLIAEPEATTRELCRFLGIDWHSEMLRFDRSSRVVTTASMHQVRQKLYDSAVTHWQHYAARLDDFERELEAQRRR